MTSRFLIPVQYFEVYYVQKTYSPWIACGIVVGLIGAGFVLNKYIIKLIRKNR